MINHYDPNQPRRADGQWTDAGGAIRAAASDKKTEELSFKNNRVIVDGKDIGLIELTKLPDGNIEIDRLYLDGGEQRKGMGRKIIEKVFNDNPTSEKILVYPSPPSEPY